MIAPQRQVGLVNDAVVVAVRRQGVAALSRFALPQQEVSAIDDAVVAEVSRQAVVENRDVQLDLLRVAVGVRPARSVVEKVIGLRDLAGVSEGSVQRGQEESQVTRG